ncbi:hypothetical protein Bca52824_031807 [Brassica carinata]|uniref:Disease resistance protein n=1 Tax=Brassica carinata TaxID=52824 RepID=A0A8X7V826_BRACI|nr:hypothetical protein Bca52824_031807 [Brassica carinata]
MPNIRVLNLSSTNLKEVPKQLSNLNYLRFLDLSSTEIENLPDGLEKLKNLIHLNLERTSRLRSVVGISKAPLLRVLRLRSSKCLADLNTVQIKRSPSRSSFLSLSTVRISSCDGLKELTWLLSLQTLLCLSSGVYKLQEIMNREKAAPQLQGEATLQKLETLDLSDLAYPEVRRCPNLRRLPLDSKSCDPGKTFTIQSNDKNWIKSIQWKDRATKARFKSCCLQVNLLSPLYIYSDYEQTECFIRAFP